MSELYITALGDYVERIDGQERLPATDLRSLVAETVGTSVRRIDRFIQLALIGAGRCAKAATSGADMAVYLGSGRGDLEVTIDVMQALLREGQPPKPLSFVNTVSNAACYYIAHSLKLAGRSSFVCNRYFAFESVLQLATLDLHSRATRMALVGTVDVVVPPLSAHRMRLGLADNAPVADASHWVCLQSEAPPAGALGRLSVVEQFVDASALRTWLDARGIGAEWVLATGQFMPDGETAQWSRELGLGVFDYRANRAYYDSQGGAAIGEYLRSAEPRTLLHLSRDPTGRYCATVVKRAS